jgi:Protein of unknown function (DUF3142)
MSGQGLRRWVLAVLPVAGVALWWSHAPAPPRVGGPLPHEAYVWQRAWTPPVVEAVQAHTAGFARLVVLGAEVGWQSRPGTGDAQVTWVPLRGDVLRALPRERFRLGLALRVGPYRGPFAADDAAGRLVRDTALALVGEARAQGLDPAEIQLDFDAAESQLDGYRTWVESIRHALRRPGAPAVPVTLTALPSWLPHAAFTRLARASDGFVLQVHSLERPAHADTPVALVDPGAARRWVEQAARAGVPFRVALPTHGYRLAFDGRGRFLGAAAEQGRILSSAGGGARVRELRADPEAVAGLVRAWTEGEEARPALLQGILWYRLPTPDDELNWPWPTLAAVMHGRVPRGALAVRVHALEPGLVEIEVVNTGDADLALEGSDLAVIARWRAAAPDGPAPRVLALDAVGGFDARQAPGSVRLTALARASRLGPGERRLVSWIRFSTPARVSADVEPSH